MKTILAGVLVLFSLAFAQQSRIAFINPDGQLTTINPDGSDLRVLTQGEQRFQFPVWSPDGSKLSNYWRRSQWRIYPGFTRRCRYSS